MPSERGEELTIWDSKESEFASGLEYANVLHASTNTDSLDASTINDLDWSSTPDGQSILAVGFAHHVDILCQQRMTYFEEGESAGSGGGWGVVRRIDVRGWVNFVCVFFVLTSLRLFLPSWSFFPFLPHYFFWQDN